MTLKFANIGEIIYGKSYLSPDFDIQIKEVDAD